MKLTSYTLAGFATATAATNLYVSDYSGNITSLSLSALPRGGYSLQSTSLNNATAPNPSWLTKDQYNKVVYSVNEAFSGANGSIISYRASSDGKLTVVGSQQTMNGPVHTIVYNKGKALVAAFYGGSALSSWIINSNGSLTPSQTFTFAKDPAKAQVPRPHEALLDPTGAFVVVPDLGSDLLRVFSIDNTTSLLTEQTSFTLANATGPRHGGFMRTACGNTYLFVVTELKPTISTYLVTYPSYPAKSLAFKLVYTNSTYGSNPVPPSLPGKPGSPFAAELIVSPCGKFVLTSSRGDNLFNVTNPDPTNSTKIPSDTLQVWGIDQATGALDFKQLAPAGGSWPRQFSLNRNGTLAAVSLQLDHRVAIIERKADTGLFGDILAYADIGGEVSSVIWDE